MLLVKSANLDLQVVNGVSGVYSDARYTGN